jgi:tetratricopeptide (TPR) repeat protein
VTGTETALTQARHLLQVNRPDDAIRLLTAHLRDSPQDASALTLLAWANLQLNRGEEALRASEEALAVAPGDPATWQHRSMAFRQLGRHEEAAASADEFVRLAPHLWASHYTLGLILRGVPGRRKEVAQCAHRALQLAPDSADPHVLMGLAYSDRQDYETAAACYRKALAIDPQHAFATSNLSGLDLRKGRFAKAMRGFRAAAAANPQEELFHRNIVATALSSLVKYGLMIAVLTGFTAFVTSGAVGDNDWVPRVVVLGVVLLAWCVLLTLKLRPLSRHLRGKLRTAFREMLRTRRFRRIFAGFVLHQACAMVVLFYPANGSVLPELLTTAAMVVLLSGLATGRNRVST